jgi:hypothetical protein
MSIWQKAYNALLAFDLIHTLADDFTIMVVGHNSINTHEDDGSYTN